MGRLEIIHDDKVIFDYPVDTITFTEHHDNIELSASFQSQPTIPTPAGGPPLGNLPEMILGEHPPGWGANDPDPEPRDG